MSTLPGCVAPTRQGHLSRNSPGPYATRGFEELCRCDLDARKPEAVWEEPPMEHDCLASLPPGVMGQRHNMQHASLVGRYSASIGRGLPERTGSNVANFAPWTASRTLTMVCSRGSSGPPERHQNCPNNLDERRVEREATEGSKDGMGFVTCQADLVDPILSTVFS